MPRYHRLNVNECEEIALGRVNAFFSGNWQSSYLHLVNIP